MAVIPNTHGTPVQYTVVDIRQTGKLVESLLEHAPKAPPRLLKPPSCKAD